MHELAIAGEILKIVRSRISAENGTRLKCIRLAVGRLAQVQPECLQFAVEALTNDTPLAGVTLDIAYVEPLFRCRDCGTDYHAAEGFLSPCPGCGAFGADIIRGDELDLISLEVER